MLLPKFHQSLWASSVYSQVKKNQAKERWGLINDFTLNLDLNLSHNHMSKLPDELADLLSLQVLNSKFYQNFSFETVA